jgi:transposase, IS5 family
LPKVGGKDYVDATHVIANIAIPGTIDLLRQGIKDVMKYVQEINPDLYEELGGENQSMMIKGIQVKP